MLYAALALAPAANKEGNANGGDGAPHYFITCAAFGKYGRFLWAVTK